MNGGELYFPRATGTGRNPQFFHLECREWSYLTLYLIYLDSRPQPRSVLISNIPSSRASRYPSSVVFRNGSTLQLGFASLLLLYSYDPSPDFSINWRFLREWEQGIAVTDFRHQPELNQTRSHHLSSLCSLHLVNLFCLHLLLFSLLRLSSMSDGWLWKFGSALNWWQAQLSRPFLIYSSNQSGDHLTPSNPKSAMITSISSSFQPSDKICPSYTT